MKVYAVKVGRVSLDGYFTGYDVKAYTLDKEKAEVIKEEEVARIEKIGAWWCGYKRVNGKPEVLVEELGEIVE